MVSPSRAIVAVFLLWFAGLGAAAQFAKIAVPFSDVQARYPDAGSELGWLLSLISLLGAALGVVAGSVVGRFGAKRVLILGLALGAVISVWQAGFPGFFAMLTSRLVEGISHLAVVVAAPTMIAQICSARYRGPAMTLWSTFFGVSFAFIAWVGLPLAASYGLGSLFVAHGAFMLAVAMLIALYVPPIGLRDAGRKTDHAGMLAMHLRAYRSPWISAPGAGWLFYTLTFVSLLAILPGKVPPEQAVLTVGLMPIVSIAAALLLVPMLLRVTSSVTIVLIGFALSAAVILLNLTMDQPAALAITLFATLGLVQGASFSAVPELNEQAESQALAYGLMAQTGNIGNLLGTPLLLAILAIAGNAGMVLSVTVLYGAAILAHFALMKRRSKPGN